MNKPTPTRTRLKRVMLPGESISFDGGRLVMTVQERSGRGARFLVDMAVEVRIDKAPEPVNDAHIERK